MSCFPALSQHDDKLSEGMEGGVLTGFRDSVTLTWCPCGEASAKVWRRIPKGKSLQGLQWTASERIFSHLHEKSARLLYIYA